MTRFMETRPPASALIGVGLLGAVIGIAAATFGSWQGEKQTGQMGGAIIRAICANDSADYVGAFFPPDDPSKARCMTAGQLRDIGIERPEGDT